MTWRDLQEDIASLFDDTDRRIDSEIAYDIHRRAVAAEASRFNRGVHAGRLRRVDTALRAARTGPVAVIAAPVTSAVCLHCGRAVEYRAGTTRAVHLGKGKCIRKEVKAA